MRVGLGYDSHRFHPDAALVLGGVGIPDHPGLTGHSDGDALTHAVIDALLGAAGLGSIGAMFPETDAALSGADSLELLARAVRAAGEAGWRVVNADATVVTETPRLAPWADRMRGALAARLAVSAERVSVKGKSNEGMGWIGRGEGLAAIAVVLVEPVPGGAPAATGPAG